MGIFETFTKRLKKQQRQGRADVYQYDQLPRPFRIQVVYIWTSAIGPWGQSGETGQAKSNEFWTEIHDTLAREMGVFHLGSEKLDPFARCQEHLLRADTGGALDLIELSFRWIDTHIRKLRPHERQFAGIRQDPDDAIEELNHRFREHGIGYQFVGGELIRIDSQYIHAEVVKPAISLLQNASFQGASDEFMRAHEHYRQGRTKEAIAEAMKAFESTMMSICQVRRWSYPGGASAGKLIEIIVANELIPPELKTQFTLLPSLLQSGLPAVRNRRGGHGQGVELVVVPGYLAAYALHLAAANIVLLVQAHLGRT